MPLYVIVPDRDPLLDSLVYLTHSPLIPIARVAILDAFWSNPAPIFDASHPSPDAYFSYFETQCRLALYNWQKYRISALKLKHIVDVVKMMQAGSNRMEMENYLGEVLAGDCKVITSEIVDLTVRLFFCVPIWSFWEGVRTSETTLTWVDGTVAGAFWRHFRWRGKEDLDSPKWEIGKSEYSLQKVESKQKSVKLEKNFTARNIEELAGLRIVWTGNLLDHLQIRREENTVCIFHHAAFLHYQADSDIYPKGLIQETLRTLALLIPPTDLESKNWFLRHHIQLPIDGEAARCVPLSKEERNIEKFDFWRERLTALKQFYDMAKPATPRKSLLRRYLYVLQ